MPVAAWIAIALMAPMLVSGLVFRTYHIAMQTLPMEILRQLNTPFVVAELIVIGWAMHRGFRLRNAWLELDRTARLAFVLFAATFWVGGVFVSQAAPFATLFNLCYVVHVVFLGAIIHLVRGSGSFDTALFTRIAALALAGFAVMIAIRFVFPPVGLDLATTRWQFAIPGFVSVRLFGALAAPWAALVFYLAIVRGGEPAYRGWIFAACALASGMVVWSGTRAAVLGIGVAGLIALAAYRPPLRVGLIAQTGCAILLGVGIAILLLPYGDKDFWLVVPRDFAPASADAVASGRFALWYATWSAFLDVAPFGAGPGASAWILPPEIESHIQPHNLVLTFLLNWGIVAATAAFVLLAKSLVAVHRRARRVPAAVPFVLAGDCLLTISLVDGTFHFAQHIMLWAVVMGLALAIPMEESKPPAH